MTSIFVLRRLLIFNILHVSSANHNMHNEYDKNYGGNLGIRSAIP